VFCSSFPGIFSAGLDLTELYQPDTDRLPQFWSSFQQVYLDLYGSRLSTIAAIQGHAPAAGCMLAISCDYRIMGVSFDGLIGLNEAQLGIVAPPWLGQQYMDTIGPRQAELALSLGTLFEAHEALKIGLIDEVVGDNVLLKAKIQAANWVKIPAQARVGSKKLTRQRHIDHLLANRQQDIDAYCSFLTDEQVQQNLGAYLKQLQAKKSKK
jgi:3,2-trans-enoyl-CoA isomerase